MAQENHDSAPAYDYFTLEKPPTHTNPTAGLPQQEHQFPPSFHLYRSDNGAKHYFIGEHHEHPLYAVTCHSGWIGKPTLVLHDGPGPSSGTLASYHQGALGQSAAVKLPPLDPDQQHAGSGGGGVKEQLKRHGFTSPARTFEVEVPDYRPSSSSSASSDGTVGGGGRRQSEILRRETFEWRNSRADPEAGLAGGKSHSRKLVRLAGDGAVGGDGGRRGSRHHQSEEKAREEVAEEVVAACTHSTWSGKKLFKFEFVGGGATGALGDRWAVMAVVSALGLWDRDRKNSNTALVGTDAGGV